MLHGRVSSRLIGHSAVGAVSTLYSSTVPATRILTVRFHVAVPGHKERPSHAVSLHDVLHPTPTIHSPTTHIAGHAITLHACVIVAGGHGAPPFCGCFEIVRKRVCIPSPHGWLHALHVPHRVISQSAGHGPASHVTVRDVSGQNESTSASDVHPWQRTLRVSFTVPSPHVALHAVDFTHSP